MAILHRFGSADDFDPNKMLARELAYVNTSNSTYKAGLYLCYAPGDVRRQTTEQDIINILNSSETAYTALQKLIADLKGNPSQVTNILNNIVSLQNNKLDKTGDGKDNIESFAIASAEADIVSGEKHSIIFGKILKSINTFRTALTGKAPTNHASSANTYGLGTTANYGHVKIVNTLTQSSHADGLALSPYQAYLLDQNKINKSSIIQSDTVGGIDKVPSAEVTKALGLEVDALTNNLIMNTVTYTSENGVTITVFDTIRRIGKVVYIGIRLDIPSTIVAYAKVINFTNLPTIFITNQLLTSDKGRFFCSGSSLHTDSSLTAGTYYVSGVAILQ